MNDLISVIIPVYNGEAYLAEAIDSVLAQSYQPLELLVVDDGSTDGSRAIAESYPQVRYYFQTNAGQSVALNRGIDLATGKFLAFLDADDLWALDKLQQQMAALAADPALEIVYGLAQQFRDGEPSTDEVQSTSLPLNARLPGAMLLRRETFDRVGKFHSNWTLGNVIDWVARADELQVRSLILQQIVLRRRLHDSNIGIRKKEARNDYLSIVKAALDRRRQSNKTARTTPLLSQVDCHHYETPQA